MDWRDVRRTLFPRKAIEEDVEEELRFHIEERVRGLVAQGRVEAEAREEVLRKSGDVRTLEEMCRRLDSQRVDDEERRGRMEALMRDVRLAVRTMTRSAGFTATVVATLALAIGATTAIFGVLEAVALRALPFPDADRLAIVWQNDRATGTVRENASTSDYYDYVERSRTFDDLAMFSSGTAVLSRDDAPAVQLNSVEASRNLLSTLGVEPRLGRGFTEDEDRPDGPLSVMLAEAAWVDLFGGDASVIGRTITVDDLAHEVVGVLPGEVEALTGDADIVFNVATMEETLAEAMGRERFASTVLMIFAAVAAFLAVLGVHGVLAYLVAQRGHEVGVRMALGATRHDVVRMVLRQGATMTVAGIVGGCLLFLAAAGLLQSLLFGVSVTSPSIYIGVALTLGMAALAGSALPALRAASIDPVKSLRAE